MTHLTSTLRPHQSRGGSVSRQNRGATLRARPSCSVESCIAGASLFFTLFANQRFWFAWSASQDWSRTESWLLTVVTAVLLTAVHCLILGVVVGKSTAKPLLASLFILTALASHYMGRYTVFFDASMVRNIFHTDLSEARELLSVGMLRDVLVYGCLPALLVSRLDLQRRTMQRALVMRALFLLATMLAAGVSLLIAFQDLSALLRNQKEVRYLITPGNFIVSSIRVAAAETEEAKSPRLPIGTDAVPAASSHEGKPRLLVVVVGETVRAANWGLNGYQRQTTPELAASNVINFPRVTSCGTNTEVSVPCMFSPYGRRNYDEKQIRRHESVLHVMERAGIKTIWRDNQSGCKGACEGLEFQRPEDRRDARLCNEVHCLDEILLDGLEAELHKNPRDLVIVLHQLGNHGPAYSHRYPDTYRRFTPTCDDPDLGKCSREQIVNSYDNAVLYTDHFLAQTIRRLQGQVSHEAALIYLSDHGESLGEKGVYLHGLPYAIAPREQTEVPMLMWLSPGFSAASAVDGACLRTRAGQPASHDYLFHSMLGLMRVQTSVYDPAFDVLSGCHDKTEAGT
ncbi:MAG TPA: phosphoethanolamine--lipid A transferase [Noviherbaspirillum sp.]|uniref:phosphoethanolamine transferase n=1 Tax=Noviherbaspirillum sp. TaxID=1926288 RepID=UPI002F9417C6